MLVCLGSFDQAHRSVKEVEQGLLLTETAGSWATGTEAALPADSTNLGAELTSVSCASAGNCTAVGS